MTCTSRRRGPRVKPSLLAVLLAASGVCVAYMGGGLSPIGVPQMGVRLQTGGEGHVWNGNETMQDYGTPKVVYGGSVYIKEQWPSDIPSLYPPDVAEAYSDDTGTFWANAERYTPVYLDLHEPKAVAGIAQFLQTFVKNTDDAWARFTVSEAYLFVDRGIGFVSSSGARADVVMEANFLTEADGWIQHRQFEQKGFVGTAVGGAWKPIQSEGPMTYVVALDTDQAKSIYYDRYTGSIDISSVPVGGVFTLIFNAYAGAESGFAEGRPHAAAYLRDPLKVGGGLSLSVEGLTPLNTYAGGAVPRDRAQAQAIQPDGRIVAAGHAYAAGGYDFALARYNGDGSLDAGFGSGGKLTTDIGGHDDAAYAVVVQSDGKIVVAGTAGAPAATPGATASADFALARYNPDGTLDNGFGTGGKVTLDFAGGQDVARAVIVQSDGRIVVAGCTGSGGVSQDFALARLQPDGSPDAGFGVAGKVTTDFAGAADCAHAVVVQADGKIVVAGRSDSAGSTKTDFALARYNADGSLDAGFGSGGKTTTDFSGGADAALALALQNDGRIVAAGWAFNGANNDIALARYNADGSLDGGCAGGKRLRDLAGAHDEASAVAIQTDGKIVVGGNTQVGAQRDFAIARFTSSCADDAGFGNAGVVSVDFAGANDRIAAVAIQGDAKIVASGYAATSTGDDFAMLRLNP
ncbi:MAG: hypothetical protein OHK0044_27840 [Burkholderiaceae bacterium]